MTDFELITNPNKCVYLKVSLLNDGYQEVETLEGEMLELSLTISSESSIRRIANASFHIEDSVDLGTNYFGLWLDRMVQLSYGVQDLTQKNVRWFLLGSFLFTSSSYRFDVGNRQLNLSIADMMAAATEERGSQIGTDVEYLEGTEIKDALASTVGRFSPYKRYEIVEFEDKLPYDIIIPRGSYPYEALKKIIDLFPWYEQFYSKDGVYTVKKVAITMSEPVVLTNKEMEQIIISEDGNMSYADIKNTTEIWGKNIDANYTAEECVSASGVYELTIHSTYEHYEEGSLICFTPDEVNGDNQKIKAQDLEAYAIWTESGNGTLTPITKGLMQPERAYVVKYQDKKFLLQGEATIHAMCMEYTQMPNEQAIAYLKEFYNCNDIQIVVNPESRFACDVIGVKAQVLSDGDFANIYTTQLAHERAAYENWKSTRLQDSLTIDTLFVPWLDVNQKIEYTSIATGITAQYLVKKIQVKPSSGTMTISLVKFYPLYPWLE